MLRVEYMIKGRRGDETIVIVPKIPLDQTYLINKKLKIARKLSIHLNRSDS